MNYIKKAVSALGGIFLAALLMAALAPRAARGVVATLVQVANTSANPVPVNSVRESASNYITLSAIGGFGSAGETGWFQRFPDGTSTVNPYSIPAGEQFVITDIVVNFFCANTSADSGCPKPGTPVSIDFVNGTTNALYYTVQATYAQTESTGAFGAIGVVHSDHLISGIVVSQLLTPVYSQDYGLDHAESFTVNIQGYLTP